MSDVVSDYHKTFSETEMFYFVNRLNKEFSLGFNFDCYKENFWMQDESSYIKGLSFMRYIVISFILENRHEKTIKSHEEYKEYFRWVLTMVIEMLYDPSQDIISEDDETACHICATYVTNTKTICCKQDMCTHCEHIIIHINKDICPFCRSNLCQQY